MNKTMRFIPAIMMVVAGFTCFANPMVAAFIAFAAAAVSLIPQERSKE